MSDATIRGKKRGATKQTGFCLAPGAWMAAVEHAVHCKPAMRFVKDTAFVLLAVLGIVLATIGVLTVTRSTPVSGVIAVGDHNSPPPVGDSLFARTMELYTGTRIEPGNSVQLLLNGNGTYQQLWRDLASAQHTITVQMYFSLPGAVADSLAKYLIGRAHAGVRVAVLLDAFGSAPLRRTGFADSLRAAGVEVAWLRSLHWWTLNRATTRSHARIVVIDGRVGYTGGFGLADYWLGDGLHEDQWRESNVRFEGPAVAQLQAAFAAGWAEATGVLLTGDLFFPPSIFRGNGPVDAGLMHTIPGPGSTPAERYLAISIVGARKTLYITNSYFVPDQDFRNMLKAAAHRGVDVRVLTVSDKTDVKTTWYAGRDYYEELLRAGVRIYEYQPTMIHSKTLVVDGLWSSVGSMNFDNRSMTFNNETVLFSLDPTLGAEMNRIFANDLTHSREITLPEFQRRGFEERALEWGAEKLWRVL